MTDAISGSKIADKREPPRIIGAGRRYLMVTGHDMRSRRKANVHFIARELAKRGPVDVFSVGFSLISLLRGRDPRIGLQHLANKPQEVDGITNYLWYTPLHPGNFQLGPLRKLGRQWFERYRASAPEWLWDAARKADVIVIESGIGILFASHLRQVNRRARLLYIASDELETVGTDPYLCDLLRDCLGILDGIRLPSKNFSQGLIDAPTAYYVPHGLELPTQDELGPSPLGDGMHAVSVGSMLFDKQFFEIACEHFPDIKFHVIGSGVPRSKLPASVEYYGEMPHRQTLGYIANATIGLAPYRSGNLPKYLADTSMKLMQYQFYRKPAVCPTFVVGEHAGRYGYVPGDPGSICAAINMARQASPPPPMSFQSWSGVVDRVLDPQMFVDTRLG